jgi:hypothetical protein
VVVDDFDVMSIIADPTEADPPLIVDADAVLAAALPFQRLEPVTRREAQEGEFDGRIDQLQFGHGALLEIGGQPARRMPCQSLSVSRLPKLLITGKAFECCTIC